MYKYKDLLSLNKAFDFFAAIKLYTELNSPVTMNFINKILNYQRPYSQLTRFYQNRNIAPPFFKKRKCQTSL